MEILIIIAISTLFGAAALSAAAQRTPPQPQVIYLRPEPLEALRGPRGESGLALILFCLVVFAAIWLL
jgi:hypothetical protein